MYVCMYVCRHVDMYLCRHVGIFRYMHLPSVDRCMSVECEYMCICMYVNICMYDVLGKWSMK